MLIKIPQGDSRPWGQTQSTSARAGDSHLGTRDKVREAIRLSWLWTDSELALEDVKKPA